MDSVTAPGGTYVAPDGTAFADLRAYRRHIFNNYFTFAEQSGVELRKLPGEVNGGDFRLSKLSGCQVLLLDHMERLIASELSSCEIFIGPCMESVSIDKATKCTITVACKELRLTDCSDCTIHAFASEGIQLDACHGIQVGAFNGAYSGLTLHFSKSKLSPNAEPPRVTDFAKNDDALPAPHFQRIDPAATKPWPVDLPNALGPPENPVFPDREVQPQQPPPAVNPPPDLNPSPQGDGLEADEDGKEYDFVEDPRVNANEGDDLPHSIQGMNAGVVEGEVAEEDKEGILEEDEEGKVLEAWKKAFEAKMKAKDEANKEKRQAMREKAEEQLEEHYAQRTNSNANRFSTNREHEQEMLKGIQEDIDAAEGNPWQRIVSLIDKQVEVDKEKGKEKEKEGADLTRMRNLLIQLKSSSNPGFFQQEEEEKLS